MDEEREWGMNKWMNVRTIRGAKKRKVRKASYHFRRLLPFEPMWPNEIISVRYFSSYFAPGRGRRDFIVVRREVNPTLSPFCFCCCYTDGWWPLSRLVLSRLLFIHFWNSRHSFIFQPHFCRRQQRTNCGIVMCVCLYVRSVQQLMMAAQQLGGTKNFAELAAK